MLENLISTIIFVNKIFGVFVTKSPLTRSWTYFLKLVLAIILSTEIIYFIFQADLNAIVSDMYIFLTILTAGFKQYFIQPENFEENFRYFESKMFKARNRQQEAIIKTCEASCRFLYYLFLVGCICTACLLIIESLIASQRQFFIQVWLPLDYEHNSIVFYGFTLICFICCMEVALTNSNVDISFAIFMLGIAAQCDLLSDQLINLKVDNLEDEEDGLSACFSRHKLILNWFKNIMDAFSRLIFIQYTSLILTYCSLFYMFSGLKLNFSTIELLIFASCLFYQLCIYCWFGNQIIIKSQYISYAAYCSQWYDFPEKVKKDLRFFMHRTQTPMIIMVGKVFPNDVNTLKAIFKTSWSYFMAFQNVKS